MRIYNHQHRDEYLHDLYSKKELLVFLNGIDWFNDKVFEVWAAYYVFVNMPIRFQDKQQDKLKWEHFNL